MLSRFSWYKQMPRGCPGGGGWAPLELIDLLLLCKLQWALGRNQPMLITGIDFGWQPCHFHLWCHATGLICYKHFNNIDNQIAWGKQGYNPLFKIKPLLDIVNPTYEKWCQPACNLSLDESMVKFKGRLFFRQLPTRQAHKVGDQAICACWGKTWLLPEVHCLQWQSIVNLISRAQPFGTGCFVIGWRIREQGPHCLDGQFLFRSISLQEIGAREHWCLCQYNLYM